MVGNRFPDYQLTHIKNKPRMIATDPQMLEAMEETKVVAMEEELIHHMEAPLHLHRLGLQSLTVHQPELDTQV